MAYNPYHVSPPEPHDSDVADCDYCGETYYLDDEDALEFDEIRCCGAHHTCLTEFAEDLMTKLLSARGELRMIKARSQRLVEQVSHGLSYDGSVDFGRWNIYADADLPGDCLVLRSSPEAGRYRVIQVPSE
jgi:hypothetical protein